MSHSQAAKDLYARLKAEAKAGGYYLNPDEDFVLDLMEGLVTNTDRYGYLACPCRDAAGARDEDLDIICPCDYRDPDLDEYGACYCALYVSEEIARGDREARPIPERRDPDHDASQNQQPQGQSSAFGDSDIPVWRCKVCGYLCARPEPPLKCPVCKADKDRFEPFP